MALFGVGVAYWDGLDADEWDRLVLGASPMPGVWRVETSAVRKIDVKKAKGLDGERLKDEGYQNAQLVLTGRVVSAEGWALLQAILPTIHPKAMGKVGAPRSALGIVHPTTQFLGIDAIYVTEIGAPQLENGICTIVIKAIEYVKLPKPAVVLPYAAIANAASRTDLPPDTLSKVAALGFPV